MSDYGLSVSWGGSKPGREKHSLELWGDAMGLAEKQKANGLIAEYTVQLFGPTGGSLPAGIFTVWGTQEQVLAQQIDADRGAHTQRLGMYNEDVTQALTVRGDAVLEGIGAFTELINSL